MCCSSTLTGAALGEGSGGAANKDGIQVVELVGGGYFFKPERVTVKVNKPVEFRVKKEAGIVPHNFVIEAPEAGVKIDEEIGEGQKSFRATFTKTGAYPFYCSKKLLFFKSHREKGMQGTVEVVE